MTLDDVDRPETVPRVESPGSRLRVNGDADTPVVLGHRERETEGEPKELLAQASPSDLRVDGQAGQPQHVAVLGGHVCDAHVVAELVLPGVGPEEPVEIGIAGPKTRPVVARPETPNLHPRPSVS